MSCVFEMTGINIGTYTYWGPHVLRVFHYPLVIGVLEAAQTICFAVAASQLRQRAVYLCTALGIVFAVSLVRFAAVFVPGAEPAAAGPGVPPERHQASSSSTAI